MNVSRRVIFGFSVLVSVLGYSVVYADSLNQTQSLYSRLGGAPAIAAVIDQFVTNVAGDRRINARFGTTDIPKLKRHLVDQVCSATGGPCSYSGRDMKTTHAGMKITNADFNALVEDLVAALDKLKVPAREKKGLLEILGPMRKEIVEVQ